MESAASERVAAVVPPESTAVDCDASATSVAEATAEMVIVKSLT